MLPISILRSHAFAVSFFLPFIVLLAIHRGMGMSDAMMIAPGPDVSHSHLFNFVLILGFYFGIAGYIFHVFFWARRTPAWIAGKLVVLAAFWAILVYVFA